LKYEHKLNIIFITETHMSAEAFVNLTTRCGTFKHFPNFVFITVMYIE